MRRKEVYLFPVVPAKVLGTTGTVHKQENRVFPAAKDKEYFFVDLFSTNNQGSWKTVAAPLNGPPELIFDQGGTSSEIR